MPQSSRVAVLGKAGARGVMAAMAMTGLRTVTTELGLVAQTPPEAILSQRAPKLLEAIPRTASRRW